MDEFKIFNLPLTLFPYAVMPTRIGMFKTIGGIIEVSENSNQICVHSHLP